MSVILYATQQGSTELVQIGPDTLLAGLTAALIGGMRSFPRAAIGGIAIGIIRQVLFYNFFGPNQAGLTQFLLFILVLVLVSRMSRTDDSGGESFAFAPRVPPVPERLREIWWVRRMPQLLAAVAFVVAAVVPLFVNSSGKQQTYTTIFGFAICAISVTVLTGWAGQLSLGQMAFAGVGALSAAAFERGLTLNIGWKSNRLISGALRPVPLSLSIAGSRRVAAKRCSSESRCCASASRPCCYRSRPIDRAPSTACRSRSRSSWARASRA
jgi:ABC-type branched-subunit amino acid transport system permease subunit